MASLMTRLRASLALGGRPRLASELSHFLAASWRTLPGRISAAPITSAPRT